MAVVFAVHGQTLFFDLTWFDDDKLILKDQASLRDPAMLVRAFRRDVFGDGSSMYRPLLTHSLMLDAWTSGTRPFGYHLTNVVLHALATIGVFLFLGSLGYARAPGAIAAVVFAVHPVLTSGVAWIPGRNDSLLAVFALTSWLALQRCFRAESRLAYAVHVGAFAAALFTKEAALALPLVALAYVALFSRASLRTRSTARLATGWLVVIVVWFVLRAPVASLAPPRSATLPTIGLNARWLVELAGAVLVPVELPVFPAYTLRGTAVGVVALLLLAVAIARVPRARMPYVLFGLTWLVVFLAPSLVSPAVASAYAYLHHRAYLPLIGLTIVGLEAGAALRAGRRVAIALALVLASLTVAHARDFRNARVFWTAAVADAPGAPDARYTLGFILHRGRDLAGAEAAYRAAIELAPDHPRASPKYHNSLGLVYEERGDRETAMAKFEDAVRLQPRYATGHANIGRLHNDAGRLPEAAAAFLRAIDADPRSTVAYISLCGVYIKQRRIDEAEHACRIALGLEPDAERALLGLAMICFLQRRYAEAAARVGQLRARGVDVDRLIPEVVNGLGGLRTPASR